MDGRNSSEYAVVRPRSTKAVDIQPLAGRLDAVDRTTVDVLRGNLIRGDEIRIWPILGRRPGVGGRA